MPLMLTRRRAAVAGSALALVVTAAAPMLTARADGGDDEGRPASFSARVVSGVQIYTCTAGADGTTSFGSSSKPEAKLTRGIHHFAGPTWHAPDGSEVQGTVVTRIPRPGTIPELELSARSTGGPGLLADVKTIRRVDTEGGLPPAGPCTAGTTFAAPYEATYIFQR